AEKVVFIPDTIPFSVAELPTQETGVVESTAVDNVARQEMELNSDPEIEPGDFVVFYQGAFADVTEDTPVVYGIVTSVSGTSVSYKQTTKEQIEKSMDTFIQQTQDPEELLEDVDTDLLVGQIQEQVLESGFAREAAEYLALMVTQTDGFQSLTGLKEFSMTDQNGNVLTPEELTLMGIGANIELSDDV
ncbi:MAG TPA: hypothetical protein DDZ89_08535, partial [Clostridiales bacterium]|nr:hypothetical protein [Clostridiales bacterium]